MFLTSYKLWFYLHEIVLYMYLNMRSYRINLTKLCYPVDAPTSRLYPYGLDQNDNVIKCGKAYWGQSPAIRVRGGLRLFISSTSAFVVRTGTNDCFFKNAVHLGVRVSVCVCVCVCVWVRACVRACVRASECVSNANVV